MTASNMSRFLAQGNVYLPHIMVIEKIIDETPGIRTFHFNFKDEKLRDEFSFESGQFGEYSVFGVGEATFCISSSPTRRDHLEFTLQRVGKVTNALHRLGVGAEIGFRGPYGNSFPLDLLQGKNLVFVGGGIGLAPLRSLIWNVLDNRDKYGDIDIIYGARSPADLCFKYDLDAWGDNETVDMVTTVDRGDESWKGREGFVPQVLEEVAPSAENAIAIVCGPPIMIRFTFPVLEKLGFRPEQMVTTLEKRMKCGIGKCGRCNIGNIYVCRDGPVFT
ncbi:FAD/NAD(P)-binding protein, partial [Dehalococcoidia bacterium]|nr:FAD/NAD(P)-binding protein [Dehalococcoidia bacterium]